ncbi:PerC family transcriptional regulator [Pantoea sp. AMG 501]|jgi:hypothetical protein|uniref:PerC family transcriptional regulator n=1 Tax=Pantoea sp. AMG 501 TaxID=2008894 RepID=UPI000B5A48A3|nr:PerC family transcriptional regulator [Pantoea sp. AMG 501]OWY77106.1 PerC family transcriptional regulator [Pantoea sp. AMG 501]
MSLQDSIAKFLEQRGLWQRAAKHWLTVIDGSKNDVESELTARPRERYKNIAAEIPPDGLRAEASPPYRLRIACHSSIHPLTSKHIADICHTQRPL